MASDKSSHPFLYSVALSNVQRLGQYTLEKNYLSLEDSKAAETLKLVLNNLPSIVETHESDSAQIQKCVYDLNDLLKENGDLENLSISNKTVSYLYGLNDLLQPEVVVNDERLLKSSLSFKLPTKVKSQHDQVPLHLVPCLAYCALYPKGYQIVREILVNQWMAEGFLELQTEGSSSIEVELEDIGNRYFNELLSMGVFVEPVYCFGGNISNQQAPEKVYSCQMHSDSHKLACQIASKEVYIISKSYYKNAENAIYMALHYLSYYDLLPITIRTCLCFGADYPLIYEPRYLLQELPELRTFHSGLKRGFHLEWENSRIIVFPPEIRCLALSAGWKSLKFIDWSSMQQLQTLAIDGCVKLVKVNSPVSSKMRHLYYTSKETALEIHTSSLRILQLSDCRVLTSLWLSNPANFSSLRRLRIFECPRLASLPDSIDLLSRVEELVFHNCVRLDLNCGRSMDSLPNLQHMELIGLPKLWKLPAGLQTAKALNYLMIANCVSLKSTDPVLQHLHALEILCVYDCRNLSIDPCEFQNMTALKSLDISRSTFKEGQDIWPLISHIPEIIVDGQHLDRTACFKSQESGDKKDSYGPMNFPYFIISSETFKGSNYQGEQLSQSIFKGVQIERNNNYWEAGSNYQGEQLSQSIFKGVQIERNNYWEAGRLHEKYKLKIPYRWAILALALRAIVQMRVRQEQRLFYCLLFPSHFKFEKDKLIKLWMARGLIGEPAKHFGKRFDQLMAKGYIFNSRTDKLTGISWYNINVKTVPTFLDRVKNKDHYVLVDGKKTGRDTISTSLHHVSIASHSIDETVFETLEKLGELESILFIYGPSIKQIPSTFFKPLRLMHTLDLSGIRISELPSSVGSMTQLRFLDLSFTLIERIPESISRLKDLQTLRLIGCEHLHTLPTGMKELVNLYYLEFDVLGQLTCMPKGLGSLTKLRTLPAFIVSNEEGCKIKELYHMDYLGGSFCIAGLEHVGGFVDAYWANLQRKYNLTQLHLKWSNNVRYERKDRELANITLEGLRSSNNVESFQISYYPGLELPLWLGDPVVGFTSITLIQCEVETLVTLEMLQELKHLYIYDMNRVTKMDTSRPTRYQIRSRTRYPKLETLVIDGMLGQPWSSEVTDGDFPCLSEVRIKHCPNLHVLPLLSYLKSLTYLEITHCRSFKELPPEKLLSSKLETIIIYECPLLKERCSKNREDWFKIEHVPNIWIDGKDAHSTYKDTDEDSEDEDKAEDKDEAEDEGTNKGNAEVKDKGKGKAEDKDEDEGKARTGKITKGIEIK